MATGVILLQRVHDGAINKNGYKHRQCVRCLQNCLSPPSQANRAGKMESQTREGRGEGSRPAGTRRAEQRMLSRQRKLQAGEHGPAASVQAGSSVGGNVHMQKAPGTPAPRSTPPRLSPTAGPARTHRLLPWSPPTCNDFLPAATCPHRNLSRPQKFHRAHLGAAVLLHISAIRHEDVMT